MLASTKYQHRMHRLVSLGLFLILTVGFLIPNVFFNINEPVSYLQYHQRSNEIHLDNNPEKCDILKQRNCELQNNRVQPSQIKQDQSRSKDNQAVGFQRTFWIYDFTASFFYEVNATLLAIGEYSLVFMDTNCITELGELAAIRQTENYRDEFDNTIYPRITDLAGHPNGTLGDIDGDPRIIILLSNCANYYSERNELPFDYSNQCEMIYIHYRNPVVNVVAHEFHHLIWFNNEWDEPQFILEALAQYAMYHAGYLEPYNNLAPQVGAFLPHPEESLLYWNLYNEGGVSSVIDYGSAYLFAFYIAEQYGVEILRNLIKEPADGPQGIEVVLQTAGYDITFNELYLNWITALTIDELGFCNNRYGFENLDARITRYYPILMLPLLNEPISLRHYGFQITKLQSPPEKFTVQIKKSSNQTIGVSIALHDAFGWHIYQDLSDEEETVITDNITANRIDVAYIITSFLSNSTPTGYPEYGLGPSTTIQLTLTTTSLQSLYLTITLGLIGAIVAIAIAVVTIIRMQQRLKQNKTG